MTNPIHEGKTEERHILALSLGKLPLIRTVPEAAVEQLDSNDGKDKLEQHVDDKDVEHIFQRRNDTIKHSLCVRRERWRERSEYGERLSHKQRKEKGGKPLTLGHV